MAYCEVSISVLFGFTLKSWGNTRLLLFAFIIIGYDWHFLKASKIRFVANSYKSYSYLWVITCKNDQ